jgi:hypothetical protein
MHTPLEPAPGRPDAGSRGAAAPGEGARKPHICFVAPMTWPVLSGDRDIRVVGGAEVQQSQLARGLARRGYRVSMVSIDYGQPDRTEIDGITIYNMHKPSEGIPGLRYLHPRLTSLWRALTRADADVYYQRSAAAYTGYVAAARSMRAPRTSISFPAGRTSVSRATGGSSNGA